MKASFGRSLLLCTLVVGCGGDAVGEADRIDTSGLPPFCQAALARVDAYMSSVAGQRATGPEFGGTAVVGVVADITDGMNALVTGEHSSAQHQAFVNLMTLVQYDEDLAPIPYLAERWDESGDGTELTFHLRRDVTWHDGTPTTARDVAFTFRAAVDSATAQDTAMTREI